MKIFILVAGFEYDKIVLHISVDFNYQKLLPPDNPLVMAFPISIKTV